MNVTHVFDTCAELNFDLTALTQFAHLLYQMPKMVRNNIEKPKSEKSCAYTANLDKTAFSLICVLKVSNLKTNFSERTTNKM